MNDFGQGIVWIYQTVDSLKNKFNERIIDLGVINGPFGGINKSFFLLAFDSDWFDRLHATILLRF